MLSVGHVDVKGLQQFENMLGAIGAEGPKVEARAVNHTGDKARTQVIRAMAKQTSLPQRTIRKAIRVKRATWGDVSYILTAGGGDISLKHFKPRETHKGVTAFVRGKRELYSGSFLMGGSFAGGRIPLDRLNGHVFERSSNSRFPIEKVTSGVFIPEEMVTGVTAEAFESTVADVLPARMSHELSRALGL